MPIIPSIAFGVTQNRLEFQNDTLSFIENERKLFSVNGSTLRFDMNMIFDMNDRIHLNCNDGSSYDRGIKFWNDSLWGIYMQSASLPSFDSGTCTAYGDVTIPTLISDFR